MTLPLRRVRSALRAFMNSEASGGLVLMACAALALVVANSPLASLYTGTLEAHAGGLSILHWINDGLMAVFFLLVGLEIKREFLHGQLRTWRARALPGIGAVGGMIVPALVFVGINLAQPATLRGWAIPAATDIAFALGVLALLGDRVPASLKVFLTALAVLDDLGAVLIIALFYTSDLSLPMLGAAAVAVVALFGLNRFGVRRLWPYLLIGALLWWLVLRSGVHATIAGVLLALPIPAEAAGQMGEHADESPLHRLEEALSPWVAFLILPIFAFANAGVSIGADAIAGLTNPVTLGVALGLFLGKQIGVLGSVWIAVTTRIASRPSKAGWIHIYGVALLCGIGFTMSLFIGLLAFAATPEFQTDTKIGVLLGSILSACTGALVLRLAPRSMSPTSRGPRLT
ncbi:Na+/H+ antiporter NhaA [Lichenihabitans psoromatis]|uniref:Na+/H+ antiporter NhaA n=1 Tax=Lichenihabitans psoromatis TaxID=2528642 RepID=UPI001038429D|nr:Na+/H+ antiporter NhaA [Lichenihabitans psoromatis]